MAEMTRSTPYSSRKRRADSEQMVLQGCHELEPLQGPAHDGVLAQARGGKSDEGGHECGSSSGGGLHESDLTYASVTGVAFRPAVERSAQQQLPDGAGRDQGEVGLPPGQLKQQRGEPPRPS